MDVIGKIIEVLPGRSGTSARGDWRVGEFVLETIEQYPKKMVFSVWGDDRLKRFNIQQGQDLQVFFDIDAREYNGRWYNSIRAYDVRAYDPSNANAAGAAPMPNAPFPPAPPAPAASPAQPAATPSAPSPVDTSNAEDDLPF